MRFGDEAGGGVFNPPICGFFVKFFRAENLGRKFDAQLLAERGHRWRDQETHGTNGARNHYDAEDTVAVRRMCLNLAGELWRKFVVASKANRKVD